MKNIILISAFFICLPFFICAQCVPVAGATYPSFSCSVATSGKMITVSVTPNGVSGTTFCALTDNIEVMVSASAGTTITTSGATAIGLSLPAGTSTTSITIAGSAIGNAQTWTNGTPVTLLSFTLSGTGTTTAMVHTYVELGGDGKESDCNSSPIILPVQLLNFQAQPQGKTNFLDWQTANEKDNDGFSIERSAEGKVFKTIGFVKGHGTTTEKQSYTFTDDTPLSISYYRLKMIDFDGTFEYSKVVSVIAANKTQKLNIKAYPNPARHIIAIEPFDTFESMNIYNLQGVLLVQSNQTEINTSIISSGIYILEVKSKEGDMSRIKFVKE